MESSYFLLKKFKLTFSINNLTSKKTGSYEKNLAVAQQALIVITLTPTVQYWI